MKTVAHLLALAIFAAAPFAVRAQTNGALETSCRACHVEARPEVGHAELAPCTRVTTHSSHKPAEGPETIVMSEGTGHYGRVVFSHRVHAEMAEIGRGCIECHHEAAEGRAIRKCGECHSAARERADLETPDLRGAIHRQCSECHATWSEKVSCSSCHLKGERPERSAGSTPPQMAAFYRFHQDVSCAACHEKGVRDATRAATDCAQCHRDWPKNFRHEKTGFVLDDEHADASCSDCHDQSDYAAKPTCVECHDDKSFPKEQPGKRIRRPKAGGGGRM